MRMGGDFVSSTPTTKDPSHPPTTYWCLHIPPPHTVQSWRFTGNNRHSQKFVASQVRFLHSWVGCCENVPEVFRENVGLFWQNVGLFWQNVGLFKENAVLFWENKGLFSGNAGVFSENIGLFSENIGLFWENVGLFWEIHSKDRALLRECVLGWVYSREFIPGWVYSLCH